MRKQVKKLILTVLTFQLLVIVPVIAESVHGLGSDEISLEQSALMIDSLHTQDPPWQLFATMVSSYYGSRFHGRRTASGEVYNQQAMTCAHRTLPFDTELIVTNPLNGKTVEVRVNDRGPFVRGRDLDLSYAAAKELGIIKCGVAPLEVIIIHPENSDSQLISEILDT